MLHTSLGDVLREKAGDNLEEAIAEYRLAIEIDREYSWVHNNLGLVWRGQGKINDAIADFRNAADVNQDDNETIKENLEHPAANDAGALVR